MDAIKYEQLLKVAKRFIVAASQFTEYDIVHDAIIEYGENISNSSIKTVYHKLNRLFRSELLVDSTQIDRGKLSLLNDVVCSDKMCKRCNDIFPISFFPVRKMRSIVVRHSLCNMCYNEYSSEWRKRHPEKIKSYQSKAYKKWVNKPGVKEGIRKRLSESRKKDRRLITDAYIKQILCREGIKSKDVTPEIIQKRRIKLIDFRKNKNENRNILNHNVHF